MEDSYDSAWKPSESDHPMVKAGLRLIEEHPTNRVLIVGEDTYTGGNGFDGIASRKLAPEDIV